MDNSLEKLKSELTRALAGLDAPMTQLRPHKRPNAWTVQQIVRHLILTYVSTQETLAARLAKGAGTRRPASAKQRLLQLFVLKGGFFPSGVNAPEIVKPGDDDPAECGEELRGAICSALSSFDNLTERCAEVLGREGAVTHFVLGPLSMAQWKKFHLVHGRHHVKQIWAIRREHGV